MRVGYLTSQYPGTSHTFIRREVAALRALGTEVETFSVRPPTSSELEDEIVRREADRTFVILSQSLPTFLIAQLAFAFGRPGAYCRTLALALRHRVPGLRAFAMSFVYFAEALVLAQELRRRHITRVHNHFANAGAIVGYLATQALGVPWSFTIHGISETDYPAGLLLRNKIEAAEFVACASYFGRSQAMRLVEPDQWRKLQIVRCGLQLDHLPRLQNTLGKLRIICVGRLAAEKGQAGLLQAFAKVVRAVERAELILIGDGPERNLLDSEAEALGISAKVTFAGRKNEQDTLAEIARSDILVLSSFMEGLPVVLMEAMAIGVPVVASRVAGIPELVEDGKTGLLFTPSDWGGLASCLMQLMVDPDLRATLASSAQKTIFRKFESKTSALQMQELFAGGAGTSRACSKGPEQ